MAFTSNFVSEAILNLKFGSGANLVTGMTEANKNAAVLNAESVVNVLTRHNWTSSYANLGDGVKFILNEAAACWAAMDFAAYDTTSYASRIEAEDIINVNWAKFWKLIEALQDQKIKTFMGV